MTPAAAHIHGSHNVVYIVTACIRSPLCILYVSHYSYMARDGQYFHLNVFKIHI